MKLKFIILCAASLCGCSAPEKVSVYPVVSADYKNYAIVGGNNQFFDYDIFGNAVRENNYTQVSVEF